MADVVSSRGGRVDWSALGGGEGATAWYRQPPMDWAWLRSSAWAGTAFLALVVGFRLILPIGVPFGVLIYGVVIGCINALIAVSLILIYRSNRIINFAQAEIGVFGAILFEKLYRSASFPYPVAIVCGVAASALLGAALERVVVRRFFTSPRLILTVVTIGLAQIVVVATYATAALFNGLAVAGTTLETPLSGFTLRITGVVFRGDEVLLLAVTPVIIGVLNLFLRRTDFGVAVRASAESGERAALLGIPVKQVSTVMWIVAAAMTGLATILRSPVVGLVSGSTVQGQGMLLRALTAAVLAKMDDLRIAVVAAIFLGVTEQALYFAYAGSTISDAVFVAIIIGGLLLQRRTGGRAEDTDASSWSAADVVRPVPPELRRLPAVRWGRVGGIVLAALPVVAYGLLASPSKANLGAVIAIYGLVAVSLVILMGWAGQLSLGQFGIVGFGAAVGGKLVADSHADFLVALVAGGLAAALVAVVLGTVALKVRGFFFAVTSLAFAVSVQTYFLNERYFKLLLPVNRPERPMLFGRFDLESEHAFYWFAVTVLVLFATAVVRLRRTRTGRTLNAIRDNEKGAQAYGISQARAKLTAFALSGFVAGVAGAMLAVQQHSVAPSAYQVNESLRVFSMVVIGGVGSVLGGVLGAVFVRVVANVLPNQFAVLATGLGLLVVLYVLPGGLVNLLYRLRDGALRRLAARRGLIVPSLLADVADRTGGAPAPPPDLDLAEVETALEERERVPS